MDVFLTTPALDGLSASDFDRFDWSFLSDRIIDVSGMELDSTDRAVDFQLPDSAMAFNLPHCPKDFDLRASTLESDPTRPPQQSTARDEPELTSTWPERRDLEAFNANTVANRDSKARPLPPAEWKRHRPRIFQLYIVEGLKLEKVRQVMKERHGFDATEQQYKYKFRQWQKRKNYTRQQKNEVIRLQEYNGKPTTPAQPNGTYAIILNHKEVRQHRIERYRRTDLRRKLAERQSAQISTFQPRQSLEDHNVEVLLLETKYYFFWCLEQSESSYLEFSVEGNAVNDDIYAGTKALRRSDRRRAFAHFNRACSNIRFVLNQRFLQTMTSLVDYCGDERDWEDFPEARLAVLRYFQAVARETCGSQHPFSRVLGLLVQGIAWASAMRQVASLLLENAQPSILESNETLLHFQVSVCHVLLDADDVDHALRELSRVVKQVEQILLRSHWLVQDAKFELAWVHYQCEEFLEAEDLWLEVIELCCEKTGQENESEAAIRSCRWLGRFYAEKGRVVEAERYLVLAFEGALREWGEDDTDTYDYLNALQEFLEERAMTEEAHQLEMDYQDVLTSLDAWYLDDGDQEEGD